MTQVVDALVVYRDEIASDHYHELAAKQMHYGIESVDLMMLFSEHVASDLTAILTWPYVWNLI
jgi:hypothetical protein